MTLFVIYLTLAIGVSFLCSLLEASLLSVPRSHVALMREKGSRAGTRLEKMKTDMDRPLAAILTLNTFAHTLGAAGVGAQATIIWGKAWLGVVSFIVTLAILIFSEIIPKTIGAVHAKRLAGFTAWAVHWLIIVLLPVVVVCDWISKLFTGHAQHMPTVSREEVHSIASLAHQEGEIDEDEAHIIRNLIVLRDIPVRDVMTPRTVLFTLRGDQTVDAALDGHSLTFARVPVVGRSADEIKGVIHRHDLDRTSREGGGDTTLESLARPVHIIPEGTTIADALREFLKRSEQFFIVVDEYGGTAGVVTLEDALETLLGTEIVDETDTVEDMRKLAVERLRARHARENRTDNA